MTNEEILQQIQNLSKTMNTLMEQAGFTKSAAPTGPTNFATPPAGASPKPAILAKSTQAVYASPTATIGLPAVPGTPPAAAKQDKDGPLGMAHKLVALAETSVTQADFCKQAKIQFNLKRTEARQKYREIKKAAPIQADKLPPKMATEAWEKVAGTPPAPVRTIPTTVVPVRTAVVQSVPIPPAAMPVAANDIIAALTAKVQKVLTTKGQIEAIRFIRNEAGMDLLTSKLWTDSLADPKIPYAPTVLGAMRDYVQRIAATTAPVAVTPTAKPPASLQDQVQAMRKEQLEKATDPIKAQAEKQHKIDIAADNKNMLVQAARTVARVLGVKGPVTIDDVTFEMSKTYNVLATKGKKQNWKGSVFASGEWVFIGETPSRQVSSHGRPVGMWALKSWLQDNTLNGKETHISSFVVSRLYSDFKRINPKVELQHCNAYIGDERVAAEIRENIKKSGNRLYEVPVSWIPGAVGALILPPEPKKLI